MNNELLDTNKNKIIDALSRGVDIVDFVTGVIEFDENAPLVIPTPETMYFISRGFSWFLSPHLSRVSNNINMIILCSAAQKYTLRLVKAKDNAKNYIENNFMSVDQAKKYYEKNV